MCQNRNQTGLCMNFKCPHNLFWEALGLDRRKIRFNAKAREIGNCCRLILKPWSPFEISEAWGLSGERVRHLEEVGLNKALKKPSWHKCRPGLKGLKKRTAPTSSQQDLGAVAMV